MAEKRSAREQRESSELGAARMAEARCAREQRESSELGAARMAEERSVRERQSSELVTARMAEERPTREERSARERQSFELSAARMAEERSAREQRASEENHSSELEGHSMALAREQRWASAELGHVTATYEASLERLRRNEGKLLSDLERLSSSSEIHSHLRVMLDHAVVKMNSMDRLFLDNFLTRTVHANASVPVAIAALADHYADVLGFQEYVPLARVLKWPLKTWVKKRRKRARTLFELRAHMHGIVDLVAASVARLTSIDGLDHHLPAPPSPLAPTFFVVNASDEGRVISKLEHLPRPGSLGTLVGEAFPACGARPFPCYSAARLFYPVWSYVAQ